MLKFLTYIPLVFIFNFSSVFAQLKGNYTIGGSNPNYTTITSAVTELNLKGVSGPVIFNIRPGTYLERVSVSKVANSSSINTITFQSESGKASDVIILSAGGGTPSDHYTFQIKSAQHIILNKLTVKNIGTGFASAIHLAIGADSNVISNCIVITDSVSASGNIAGIIASSIYSLAISITSGFDRNTSHSIIENNEIHGGSYGIALVSFYGNPDSGNLVKNNRVLKTTKYGIYANTNDNLHILNNIVIPDTITNKNVSGIYIDGSPQNCIIDRNYIRNAGAYGIYAGYGFRNGLISNNMLCGFINYIFSGYGIIVTGSDSTKIYNNSVYYNGKGSARAIASYALYLNSFSTYDIQNNILCNTGGNPGVAFGVVDSASISISDRNCFLSTGTNLIEWHGVKYKTLTEYQNISGKEKHSIVTNPLFNSLTDLHTLNPLLDGKGNPVNEVKIDFDGDQRNYTQTDIGADEFILNNHDIGIIGIEPENLQIGSNIITAIFSNDGKKSLKDSVFTVSYSIDGGKTWSIPEQFISKELTSSYTTEKFSFETKANITKSEIYIVCLRINSPGIQSDKNYSNNQFCQNLCVELIGNIFTIGPNNADFINISEALQVLKNLPCPIKDSLLFNIQTGTYEEKISIPEISGVSFKNNITFQSESGNPEDVTIINSKEDTSSVNYTIQLSGASFIKLKNLSLEIGVFSKAGALHLTNASHNILIQNCIFKADSTHSPFALACILSSGTKKYDEPVSVHNIKIISSTLKGGTDGIYITGADSNNLGNYFENNTILSQTNSGIRLQFDDCEGIIGNYIKLLSGNKNGYGILMEYADSNFSISNNYISNAGFTGLFISYANSETELLVSNNMIAGGFSSQVNGYGVFIAHSQNIKLYYNSILYDGTKTASSAFHLESCYETDIINNIFSNSGGGYSYYVDTNFNTITSSDYNDLYTAGTTLAYWGQDQKNLTSLKIASGNESHSVSVDPQFVSVFDLHTYSPDLDKKAKSLSEVEYDFDKQLRNSSTADIGADEFTIGIDAGVIVIINPSGSVPINADQTISVKISNYGNEVVSNFPVSYSVDLATSVSELFSSSLLPGNQQDFIFKTTWKPIELAEYLLCVKTNVSGDIDKTNDEICKTVQVVQAPPTGIFEVNHSDKENVKIKIYPNPAQIQVHLELINDESNKIEKLEIFTIAMEKVWEKKLGQTSAKQFTLNLESYSPGIYLIRLQSKSRIAFQKMVVIN